MLQRLELRTTAVEGLVLQRLGIVQVQTLSQCSLGEWENKGLLCTEEKKERKMAKNKLPETLTEVEKKYDNSEELKENGFVFDEDSGMYIVIPRMLVLF